MFPENVETVNNINSLTSKIKSKIGILVLYKTTDHEYLTNFMKELKKQTYLIDILVKNINLKLASELYRISGYCFINRRKTNNISII